MRAEDRFENVLVARLSVGDTQARHVRPCRFHHPVDLGVGQRLCLRDAPRALIAGPLGANLALDPELAKDFHAARGDAGELVLDRRAGMSLDDHAVHTMVCEQKGGCQAVQPSADDKD